MIVPKDLQLYIPWNLEEINFEIKSELYIVETL